MYSGGHSGPYGSRSPYYSKSQPRYPKYDNRGGYPGYQKYGSYRRPSYPEEAKEPSHTVFFYNLNYHTPEKVFYNFARDFGEIANIHNMIDKKGQAFVTYYNIRDAKRAVVEGRSANLDNRSIGTNFAFKSLDISRRDLLTTDGKVVLRSSRPLKISEAENALLKYGDIYEIFRGEIPEVYICTYYDIRDANDAVADGKIFIINGIKACIEPYPSDSDSRQIIWAPLSSVDSIPPEGAYGATSVDYPPQQYASPALTPRQIQLPSRPTTPKKMPGTPIQPSPLPQSQPFTPTHMDSLSSAMSSSTPLPDSRALSTPKSSTPVFQASQEADSSFTPLSSSTLASEPPESASQVQLDTTFAQDSTNDISNKIKTEDKDHNLVIPPYPPLNYHPGFPKPQYPNHEHPFIPAYTSLCSPPSKYHTNLNTDRSRVPISLDGYDTKRVLESLAVLNSQISSRKQL